MYEGEVSTPVEVPEEAVGCASSEYEGDASGSSESAPSPGHFDMSTLHDEISNDGREPFVPHSEETMGGYEEGEVSGTTAAGRGRPHAHPPSPDSADSWMAYSSTSSESWRHEVEHEREAEPEASGKRPRTRPSPTPSPGPSPHAPPPDERVDIRMIDFAHTAFAGAAAESPLATATPHHGPDCGFLTGIDSLKRLLTEILHPQPYS